MAQDFLGILASIKKETGSKLSIEQMAAQAFVVFFLLGRIRNLIFDFRVCLIRNGSKYRNPRQIKKRNQGKLSQEPSVI